MVMQKKSRIILFLPVLFFLFFNIGYEFYNASKVEVPNNSSVPNLDSNCYYTKNQIIRYFNNQNIDVVDIVQYSENQKCIGRVIGSNLIPGKQLDGLSKVFIISNTSFYNAYFSYNILAAISFLILIFFFISNKSTRIVYFLIFITTLLNFNSFLISSYRHNTDGSRIIQFKEFDFNNHKTFSDPHYHLQKFRENND